MQPMPKSNTQKQA